jgi:hypothetical protein
MAPFRCDLAFYQPVLARRASAAAFCGSVMVTGPEKARTDGGKATSFAEKVTSSSQKEEADREGAAAAGGKAIAVDGEAVFSPKTAELLYQEAAGATAVFKSQSNTGRTSRAAHPGE